MTERLPTHGEANWDTILNGYLGVSLAADGTLKSVTAITAGSAVLGTNPASAGVIRIPNAGWIAGRNAANGADVNMWKVNTSDYLDFGTTIYRDDFGIYAYPKNWITLFRNFGSVGTAGERDGVIKAMFQSKHPGASSSRMAICAEADDRYDVVNKTITGAANNGSGAIRITAVSHGFATGDKIAVYGVTGTTEANGLWTITSISANTFDLQGSTFTNAYSAGGIATNRGVLYGFVAAVGNSLDRGGLTGTALNGDDTACYVGFNTGTAKGTDAYYLGRNSSITGSEWTTSFTVDANADYGIRLNGTFANYGLDFYAGTFTGGMIRFKNNSSVYGRNAANSNDVEMFRFNTLNEVQFAAPARFNGNVALAASTGWTFGAGANFAFATSTGTKFGTATNQLMGFWGATPVARPSAYTPSNVTTDRSYNADATSIDELADVLGTLIADLQSMGLVG